MSWRETYGTLAAILIGTVYSAVLGLFVISARNLEGLPALGVALAFIVPGAWLTMMAIAGVRSR